MRDYLNSTTYNIAWFKKLNDDELLEMSPSFQRNPVWTIKQKSYLIDSVLGGYPIPEIYLQEKISADGKSTFVVVDGQQRIRSILSYIDCAYQLEESETTKWANMRFSDLNESDKKTFFAYKFVVRLLPEIEEDEIRGIFQRINKNNVALNSQELRQSTYSGEFIKLINNISDKSYWKDLGVFSPAKIRRMLDAEYISEVAVAYLNGHQNKKEKLDNYYVMYEENFDDGDELNALFDLICNEVVQLLPNIKKTRWSNMVDFYTLFLVLAQYKDKIPFSSDFRDSISKKLLEFGESVSLILKGKDGISPSESEKKYAAGVRNSSDLGSRKQRFAALNAEISSIVK